MLLKDNGKFQKEKKTIIKSTNRYIKLWLLFSVKKTDFYSKENLKSKSKTLNENKREMLILFFSMSTLNIKFK